MLQHVNNVFELQSVDPIKKMSHGTTASTGSDDGAYDSDTAGKFRSRELWILESFCTRDVKHFYKNLSDLLAPVRKPE